MDSWAAPDLPVLPAPADGTVRPRLSLYDTARGGQFPTGDDASPDRTMYVCGITPYDATHMGHAATMIAFDLANRFWRDEGHQVEYV
jgi:L-cysteine:1D-myo-inositol 2-amino-2-deoxy-alpha-D-glucopyranoside ligase